MNACLVRCPGLAWPDGVDKESAGHATRDVHHRTDAKNKVEGQSALGTTLCIILTAVSIHILAGQK